MLSIPSPASTLTTIALLGLVTVAAAHGNDEHMNMSAKAPSATPNSKPETYFQYGEHSAWMVAHIFLMTISWVFFLPVGIMLSISHSRYNRPIQFLFLVCNGAGILLAVIYNTSTPNLYPNNAHHKLGWVVTWIIIAQAVLGIISTYGKRKDNHAFIPVSQEAMEEHQRIHYLRRESYRFSYDSGHGTETNSGSRSPTCSDGSQTSPHPQDVEEDEEEKQGLLQMNKMDRILSKLIPGTLSNRLLSILGLLYNAVDRLILPLGFAVLCTGWITFGGLFKGEAVFSGLAHFIKGGVFFWFGILTLGRWAGCFAEIGWAWNIKPEPSNRPSAEFMESFLIFFYGCTNVFLEHLTAWGAEWSAMDLEHISLTIMFFGGGLCGMLVESKRLRDLLNTRNDSPTSQFQYPANRETQEEPASYKFPMNPIPALVILLLGIMMSSHHQESMVSTMIHSQWGNLLIGAALARAGTYILFYLSPPKSVLPGRPPTELISAFCFMAGGLIFMASARDVVETIELYNLDAMFVFTVSMGLITFLMAWVIVVIAIKGWAVRKQQMLFAHESAGNA